ncbi:MAG: type II toxin-antitoxin system VapC family toxin [Thermodesulfobacteriota bacterium]|nr:type II toxin-antitoxin system VapC family toxin [Thermodesulfobacteriota bacterium]
MMYLVDTHVLVWLEYGSERLGNIARDVIDSALQERKLAVSAISFWEIAMLMQKRRIFFETDIGVWRRELLLNGLREISVNGSVAIRAGQLKKMHGDPADRLIVATALEDSATLVTADKKILDWQDLPFKLDASL